MGKKSKNKKKDSLYYIALDNSYICSIMLCFDLWLFDIIPVGSIMSFSDCYGGKKTKKFYMLYGVR